MSTLKVGICNGELEGWFALENKTMNETYYKNLVTSIHEAFVNEYKDKGAEDFVKKVSKDDKTVLFINQYRLPHIIKFLINNNGIDINVELTGINPNNEEITRTISKPFNKNDVLELTPAYHPKAPVKEVKSDEVAEKPLNQSINKR